jgi:hypothetical protein
MFSRYCHNVKEISRFKKKLKNACVAVAKKLKIFSILKRFLYDRQEILQNIFVSFFAPKEKVDQKILSDERLSCSDCSGTESMYPLHCITRPLAP